MEKSKTDQAGQPDVMRLSGLEIMQAILEGRLPPAPIAPELNFWLVSVDPGEAVFEGIPKQEFTNPFGGVHGGWYGAILDGAMGCAVHTKMAAGVGYTTLEYKINITRAIPLGLKVRAVGTTSHAGRSTAVAEAKLTGVNDGRLYATGSTTCLVLSAGG